MRTSTMFIMAAAAAGVAGLAACSSTTGQSDSVQRDQMDVTADHGPAGSSAQPDGQGSSKLPKIKKSDGGQNLPKGTNVVFRMDDIQSWWCTSTYTDIMAPFTSTSTPLSVGIIAELGFEQNTTGMKTLATIRSSPGGEGIEVTSHSYAHPDGGMPDLEPQPATEASIQADLNHAQMVIQEAAGVTPDLFIAPQNIYDDKTLAATKAAGLTAVSAECTFTSPGVVDYCPQGSEVKFPNLKPTSGLGEGLTMMPAGAVIDDWNHYQGVPASMDTALTWAKSQYQNQGFVVFMLHPQDLVTDGLNCSTVDTQKIGILNQLISLGKSEGWNMTNFTGLEAAAKAAGGNV